MYFVYIKISRQNQTEKMPSRRALRFIQRFHNTDCRQSHLPAPPGASETAIIHRADIACYRKQRPVSICICNYNYIPIYIHIYIHIYIPICNSTPIPSRSGRGMQGRGEGKTPRAAFPVRGVLRIMMVISHPCRCRRPSPPGSSGDPPAGTWSCWRRRPGGWRRSRRAGWRPCGRTAG